MFDVENGRFLKYFKIRQTYDKKSYYSIFRDFNLTSNSVKFNSFDKVSG